MWEQIESNKRKSLALFAAMLAILLALGYAIGAALVPLGGLGGDPQLWHFALNPAGGALGMAAALGLWGLLLAAALIGGDSLLLFASGAREIRKEDHPQLFNVVEEMTIAAQLPRMPKVYIVNSMAMNAFAAGRSAESASVAVTAGLLGRLNRDQLQGVVAHEIAHIKNQDVVFMTRLGIMAGAIILLSEFFLRMMWFSGSGRRYSAGSGRRGGGGANYIQLIMVAAAIVLAILAPIAAQLMYFAASRKREYLADAGAAVFTRYPDGLASALEAISNDGRPFEEASRATAPMYIVNPLQRRQASGFFATHPPIARRVQILRAIGGSVSYARYQTAWNRVEGKQAGKLPKSALDSGSGLPARAPSEMAAGAAAIPVLKGMRQAGDVMRDLNKFLFLPCACGLRVKLPPEFKKESVDCPRCKRKLEVPVAQLAAAAAVGGVLAGEGGPGMLAGAAAAASPSARPGRVRPIPMTHAAAAPLEIVKPAGEWMSFKCACGASKNLGPNFQAPQTSCNQCGRVIAVKAAAG